MKDVTLLIHTYKRPECAKRLEESAREKYPDMPILVYDDTEADKGLSWGRNYLVEKAKTKYVFICDDDCIFTKNTDLEEMKRRLEADDLDILSMHDETVGTHYNGIYELEKGDPEFGDTVHLKNPKEDGLCDFVINFFLAKRESLLKHKWDERLKIGEHFAFFYNHRGKLKMKHAGDISIAHEHIGSEEYNKDRQRAWDFLYMYMVEQGLRRRVSLDGAILEVPREEWEKWTTKE